MNFTRIKCEDIAKIAIKRQIGDKDTIGNKDTFILIVGAPRTGKTTLGFNILIPYLKYKYFRNDAWKPENSWVTILKRYFATSSEDYLDKLENNPPESPIFTDEGGDTASWYDMLTKPQRRMIKALQKSGSKKNLNILIVADPNILNPYIINRAQYLFYLRTYPKKIKGNYAYVFYKGSDTTTFSLFKILEEVENMKLIKKNPLLFYKYVSTTSNDFVGLCKFNEIDPKIYDLYYNLVKVPLMSSNETETESKRYQKLDYALSTLIYNLKEKEGKSFREIQRLFIDKFGRRTATTMIILNRYENIKNMTAPLNEITSKKEEFEHINITDIPLIEETQPHQCTINTSTQGTSSDQTANHSELCNTAYQAHEDTKPQQISS